MHYIAFQSKPVFAICGNLNLWITQHCLTDHFDTAGQLCFGFHLGFSLTICYQRIKH